MFNEEIVEILGDKMVNQVKLKSGKNLKIEGVFIEAGSSPELKFAEKLDLKTTKQKYIIADKEQRTNVPGVFAVGDITNNILKQIVTATGEGAVSAYVAYTELKKG